MLPGFVGQQSGSAGDPACAGVIGAAGTAGHGADPSAVPGDAAAAFDNALSSACGTSSPSPVADKTGGGTPAASPSPTFPAWILALGLDMNVDGPDTDAAKGDTVKDDAARGIAEKALGAASGLGVSKPKGDRETDENSEPSAKDGESSGIIVDVIALTPPAVVDTPPGTAAGTKEDSAAPADLSESGRSIPTEEGRQGRTSQRISQAMSALPNTRVKDDARQQENDDVPSATIANADAAVRTNDDPHDSNTIPASRAESMRARVGAPADLQEPRTGVRTQPAPAAAAPVPGNDVERIVSAPSAGRETTTGASRPQAPGQAVNASMPSNPASRGNESIRTAPVASPVTESAAEVPSGQSPSPSGATVSIPTGEAAPEARRSSAPAADPNEIAAMKPGAPSAAASPVATGERNQSFQHGDSESHARNGAPEPPPVSRSLAWSAAMTLISAPDGTLRLASPLATPFLGAPTLLEQPPAANIDQMVQTMRVMVKEGVSEATVHLHPEHFGEVSIQVRVDGRTVSAVVHTESAGVREWLQGQESTLRGNLSEHGLQLDRLVVQRDGRQDRRHGAPQQQEQPRRRARSDDDQQPTFELSV